MYRHSSQDVCPWNVKVSQKLPEEPPFRAREFIAGKEAVTVATDLLGLGQDVFSTAFRTSPMQRATVAGRTRHAAVVLGNIATGA